MLTRVVLVGVVLIATMGGVGVVSADSHTTGNACPEDGNPSQGLVKSVTASDGNALNAVAGVNQAYDSVGCDTTLP